MNMDKFLQELLKKAEKAGFEATEAYVATGSNTRVDVFEGEVSGSQISSTLGVSFRGMINGRMGYASSEAVDAQALDMLITRAKDNAQTVRSEDKQFIYTPQGKYPKMDDMVDPSIEALSPADLIEHCLNLERAAKAADERIVRMSYCMASAFDGRVQIVNTNGLNVSFRRNGAYLLVRAVAKDGEETMTGMHYQAVNNAGELDSERVGRMAAREALQYVGAKPVVSGNYPVVLRFDVMTSLLEAFAPVFSAENAQRGISLLAGKEGETVAAPIVTLIDDPLRKDAMGSMPFDDEGVPTYTKNIIDKGMLTTLLHNLKTAHKQGVKSTGNASKAGYSAPVSIAPTNFYIQPGKESVEQLHAAMGDGLYICELAGLHAGTNTASGDFSLSAKGFLVKDGKVSHPVNQITVAGNFFELLAAIEKIGGDLWFDLPGGGVFGSPSVLLSGLSVAGL